MKRERQLGVLAALSLLGLAQVALGGDKEFVHFDEYPGVFMYYWETPEHSVEMSVTADSVSGGTALRVEFRDVTFTKALLLRETGRNEGKNFSAFEGLSFWCRGDGSNGHGTVILGYGTGPMAKFALSETKWHRVDLRWKDFEPAANPAGVGAFCIGLAPGSPKPAVFTLDRPKFVKSFAALGDEKALGEKANAAPPPAQLAEFVPARYVTSAKSVEKLKARMKAKKPVKILAWGDSFTLGSQLWTSGNKEAQRAAAYIGRLERMLRERYGYDGVNCMRIGRGGNQTHLALRTQKDKVVAEKPDLVILAVCTGDVVYSSLAKYRENWPKLVDAVLGSGSDLIVMPPWPPCFMEAKSKPFRDWVVAECKSRDIAVADINSAYLYRGKPALGVNLCDKVHPNQRGHEMFASMLFELLK